MKHLIAYLLVTFSIASATSIYAEEVNIPLYQVSASDDTVKSGWGKGHRSAFPGTIVTHDNTFLYIYTPIYIENASIVIRDNEGNTLYNTTCNLLCNQANLFLLPNLTNGEYCIELEIGGDIYLGNFEIA